MILTETNAYFFSEPEVVPEPGEPVTPEPAEPMSPESEVGPEPHTLTASYTLYPKSTGMFTMLLHF